MKEILSFLNGLQKKNTREWMEANKSQYLNSKQQFEDIISSLIDNITAFDPHILGTEPKKCIFRLHRDVRFSKDKRPYKENMGGFINKNGRKGMDGGYYIHIQPGQSMLAGGTYMPPPEILRKIRQEIDYNPDGLIKFMKSSDFKKYFGTFEGDRLKKAPKGYSPDHPNIELLRLKSYIVVHRIEDAELLKPGFLENTTRVFKAMLPLNNYIRTALDE
jgi:uncharacterized protein (TIGR02453 family)